MFVQSVLIVKIDDFKLSNNEIRRLRKIFHRNLYIMLSKIFNSILQHNILNTKFSLLSRDFKKYTMIIDGYIAYVPIIEKLRRIHQKCVFHKIMNQRTPVWKTTNNLEHQLKSEEYKLEKTLQKIQQLENQSKDKKRLKNKDKLKKKKQEKNN